MIETDLNKVLNYMKQYVENIYEHDSEPMLNYKDLQLVLEEIERLNNIINEIRTYPIDKIKEIEKELEALTKEEDSKGYSRMYEKGVLNDRLNIYYDFLNDMDKLKELKGSDKE